MPLPMMLITLLSFIANIIGTISGFGVSTVMTPVLLLFLPFTQTIIVVCIVHWFHDVWKVLLFHKGIDWSLFLYFGTPTIFAGFLGSLLVMPEQSVLLSALFGLLLVGLVIVLWYKPDFSLHADWKNNVSGGLLSGFLAGIFGIRGPIHVFFLSLFDIQKATLIATTGIISLLLDSVRLITYWMRGLALDSHVYGALIFLVPASFLGALVGHYILYKIPQRYFRSLVLSFLFVIGVRLLLSPWF